jgi:hypothetical protein
MRTKAISLRTFSEAPVGAVPKNGSRCGPFPWQNSPGSRGSRRGPSAGAPTSRRTRNVPQRRGRARWAARPSAIRDNPAPRAGRSRKLSKSWNFGPGPAAGPLALRWLFDMPRPSPGLRRGHPLPPGEGRVRVRMGISPGPGCQRRTRQSTIRAWYVASRPRWRSARSLRSLDQSPLGNRSRGADRRSRFGDQ